jgi:hypothetical protein
MRIDATDHRARKIVWRFAVPSLLAWLGSGGIAHAYCRTTTCALTAGTAPTANSCAPDGYAAPCESALPVWWRNACVSYDIQKDASAQVPYPQAVQAIASAFSKWTGAICAAGARVSIDVRDLGPVDCDQVQYSSDQGNQHVIIFHDDVWPHNDSNNTLGLTTVTFDPGTGEIFDADMEINSTPSIPLSMGDSVPANGYDFESIVTHEAGHFLGMAHSGDEAATMFAHYVPGTMSMRILTADDVAGICSIYLPGGIRSVDPSIEEGQITAAECDPTPRHGFQSACAGPQNQSCEAATPGRPGTPRTALVVIGFLATAAALRARRTVRGPNVAPQT